MKIRPLFDRVVIALQTKEEPKNGILLSSVKDDKSQIAKVLAVGEGGLPDGKEMQMKVKVGDIVIFSKYAGAECEFDGQKALIVRQSDILAIVE